MGEGVSAGRGLGVVTGRGSCFTRKGSVFEKEGGVEKVVKRR